MRALTVGILAALVLLVGCGQTKDAAESRIASEEELLEDRDYTVKCQFAGESYDIPAGETKIDDLPEPVGFTRRALAEHAERQIAVVKTVWRME